MKFCFKLGKTATETHEMLVRVYGDAVSQKMVYKWFKRFNGCAELTEDEQHSGRSSTSTTDENVSEINEMIRANRRLTIREISNACNISFGDRNGRKSGRTDLFCIMTMLCVTCLVICQFLADKNITVWPHPPYSPDLALCDFWLFSKIKLTKGNHFDMIPEIEAAKKEHLRLLTKDDSQNCFRSWQDHWNKCIDSKGD
jgi:hypothetical protein